MINEQGNLSINSDNFLPIIKKWLYTDKDIFIREIVSNGCDAISKLQKLIGIGEAKHISPDESFYISVVVDQEKKTIEVTDNGIGMTADEIKKYINQIAFSGATDFISKYQEKMDEGSQIIGHFGLGFYSAFMVADKVEINSLSYLEGAEAAKWTCDGSNEFKLEPSDRTTRGTTITLYIGDEGKEFIDKYTLRAALDKYCAFMPIEIYYDYIKRPEPVKEGEEDKEKKEETPEEPVLINETKPLWLKQPSECTDEDYIKFYHKVFFDVNDPLFWIHLNTDYPFNLKGILYFPKIVNQMDTMDGAIKLYCNQVYIADNIKEVVPEFLLLLKGVMDCPDMPLNVSRSALQNDGYSNKMSNYISKKVADKLIKLFKNERETYEKFWDDISMFIKYGCVKELKFYDKMKSALIYKTINGKFQTLDEFKEANGIKEGGNVYYVNDINQQSQYVKLFKEQNMDALILNAEIDRPFVSFLEMKEEGNITLLRVDSELSDVLKNTEEKSEEEKEKQTRLTDEVQNLFRGILDNQELFVKLESLKATSVSSMLLLSEESRRMAEIQEIYRARGQEKIADMFGDIKPEATLVLNSNNSLVKQLLKLKDNIAKKDITELVCHQLYDLALMGQKALSPEEMTGFIERSSRVLEMLVENENN